MRKSAIVLLTIISYITSLAQESKFKNYLSKNYENIDLTKSDNWNILKKDAQENQFIVLGESHGAQNPQLIDYNLLEYLNKTVGTKNYIAELDYAQAENINNYLKTGNEKSLKTVFRRLVKIHSQWGNQDFYDKIVKIKKLNKNLPSNRRITFTGIDVVQDHQEYLKLIEKLVKNKKSTLLDSLKITINLPFDEANIGAVSHFAKNLSQKIDENEKGFQKLFKDEYPLFKYLIRNLSYGSKSVGVKRPEGMYRNFRELYNIQHLENEKLYGMWGFFHAHLVPFQFVGGDFISKLTDSDHPIAKKIISIIALPIDSQYNVWNSKTKIWDKNAFSYDNETLLHVEGIEDLKELTQPYTTTLFKLNGPDSPFVKSGRLLNGVAPQGKLIGDFKNSDYGNQYIILVRNSDWLHALPEDF